VVLYSNLVNLRNGNQQALRRIAALSKNSVNLRNRNQQNYVEDFKAFADVMAAVVLRRCRRCVQMKES
jgi:hypothetical protein